MPAGRWPRRQLFALGASTLAAVLLHGCLADELAQRMAAFSLAATMPERLQAVYVRELAPTAPPPAAVAAAPVVAAARRPGRPAVAASAAEPAASAPIAAAELAPVEPSPPEPVPQPAPVMAEAAPPAATAPGADAPDAPDATPPAADPATPVFAWPGSTRLSYVLTGQVRGEIHGQAQVEWVRAGDRYQVHVDVLVGLAVFPLITRRMSSDGELTTQGLRPQRYDEDTKAVGRDRQRLTLLFDPDVVILPNGARRERPPGLQDTASQFVQLGWLFTLQPQLLRTGSTVQFPLALPRHGSPWIYEVGNEETVYTPFGPVQAFHVRPQRTVRPGDLAAELWIAPTLRYLPVRIRILQDPQTYIDMLISRRPELAAP
jgi:hypothetical protein